MHNNWTSEKIRNQFFDFFASKKHKIVPSDSILIKNDPTLMFTNAGMNQFKSFFLETKTPKHLRIANTQKCLRVSGKHNDLEEVGVDTYHHTMFEMLGNWSFGNYFKKEAILWAWELLTKIYKIDPSKLYVTVFEGDKKDNLEKDKEAYEIWKTVVEENKIIFCSKKDNFWEMGNVGPCGPCSEIHIDLRNDEDIKKIPGKKLVNKDHPLVIEIWNLVFIQFNRKENQTLESLPNKHIDTGMGFERLCMVLQNKKSNYDIDIFSTIINKIETLSGCKYGINNKTDIAFRVIADHVRAVSFIIADGQLPSNNKAGYVVKRILRRAIRYSYSFLEIKKAKLYTLVNTISEIYKKSFPEILKQKEIISNIIKSEENSFLNTLEQGINLFEKYILENINNKIIDGKFAFLLYDTYGFPLDLTQLLSKEKNYKVDIDNFHLLMKKQKDRSKTDAQKKEYDWIVLNTSTETKFLGYNKIETNCKVLRYKKISHKNKPYYEIVIDQTPFYSEAGGQVGDTGFFLLNDNTKIKVLDTYKYNNLIVHKTNYTEKDISNITKATIDKHRRKKISTNHSATHLLHQTLRNILGDHVEQKGSMVDENKLRFDFSHYQKVSEEQQREIENIVNNKINEKIDCKIETLDIEKAKDKGAKALFGEKYGKKVRVVSFDDSFSIELCGGTHVNNTEEIKHFILLSESGIASGIRRIEAITSEKAIENLKNKALENKKIYTLLNIKKEGFKAVNNLLNKNKLLEKTLSNTNNILSKYLLSDLLNKKEKIYDNVNLVFKPYTNLENSLIKKTLLSTKKTNSLKETIYFISNKNKNNTTHFIYHSNPSKEIISKIEKVLKNKYDIKGGGNKQFITLIEQKESTISYEEISLYIKNEYKKQTI